MSSCDRELSAHFYSAASLKYAPDTWHDTTPSHIIPTLGRPVLALPHKSECQARSNEFHFLWFWYATARDRTRDLPFPEEDTLPTELPGPVFVFVCVFFTHFKPSQSSRWDKSERYLREITWLLARKTWLSLAGLEPTVARSQCPTLWIWSPLKINSLMLL